MRATIHDSQTLELVNPGDVQLYLAAHDWKNLRPAGEYGFLYRLVTEDRKYDLLVPSTKEIVDFRQRIADILSTLEKVEDRSQIEIISDLGSVRSDVIRIRRPDGVDGTLRLEDGPPLMQSALDLVLAAACSATAPKAYYYGKKPSKANDYIERTRLGQTERGSFVLTIISPNLERSPEPDLFSEPIPFERQVTQLVSDGLRRTVDLSEHALRRGDYSPFREAMMDGVSANLLDAVIGLMGTHHHTVDVKFALSPEFQVEEGLQQSVTIDANYYGIIQEASRKIKEQEPLQSIELRGIVEGLKRGQQMSTGHITLSTTLDSTNRKVQMDLGAEFYDRAIVAHKSKRRVFCTGELERIGRLLVLKNITSFEIEPEPGLKGPLFGKGAG